MDDRLVFALAIAGAGFAAWAFVRYVGTGETGSGVETWAYRPYGSQGGAIPLPPEKTATPEGTETPDYRMMARNAAEVHYVPPGLFERLIDRESSFNPYAVGPTGDLGIAQLNPRFHPEGVAADPRKALDYAAQYLRSLYDRFGTWEQAVAAYNWGPTNLARYGMANIPEATRRYVHDITRV